MLAFAISTVSDAEADQDQSGPRTSRPEAAAEDGSDAPPASGSATSDQQHKDTGRAGRKPQPWPDRWWAIILVALTAAGSFMGMAGGVLKSITPPYEVTFGQNLGASIAQVFITVVVLALYASALLNDVTNAEGDIRREHARHWRRLALACGAAAVCLLLLYSYLFSTYTFFPDLKTHTPENRLVGSWKPLDPNARGKSLSVIYSEAANNQSDAWEPASLVQARLALLSSYVSFLLALAGAIFALAEVIRLRLRDAT